MDTPRQSWNDTQNTYVIEPDIPLPLRGRPPVYPFRTMEIGDSFLVDIPSGETAGVVQNRLASAARSFQRKSGQPLQVATRIDRSDANRKRVRCWRIG